MRAAYHGRWMGGAVTERSKLAAQVEDLGRARVLCLGDVMLDRYIYGEVERISPEAPIPVFQIKRETAMPGGAGNVARNIALDLPARGRGHGDHVHG